MDAPSDESRRAPSAPPAARTFGHGPLHRWLGLELGERVASGAATRLAVRAEFLQEEGVVQGGILSALADATAVYALMPDLVQGESLTSIEFKLSFLAPGLPGGGPLEARSQVLRRGRTLAVCRSEVSQDGRGLCTGLFTYLFTRGPSPRAADSCEGAGSGEGRAPDLAPS